MSFLNKLKSGFNKAVTQTGRAFDSVPNQFNNTMPIIDNAFKNIPNGINKAMPIIDNAFENIPNGINKVMPQITNYFIKTIDPALGSGFASFTHFMSSALTGGPSHSGSSGGSSGDSSSGSSGGSSVGPSDYMTEFIDYTSSLTTVDYLCIAGGAGLLIY